MTMTSDYRETMNSIYMETVTSDYGETMNSILVETVTSDNGDYEQYIRGDCD